MMTYDNPYGGRRYGQVAPGQRFNGMVQNGSNAQNAAIDRSLSPGRGPKGPGTSPGFPELNQPMQRTMTSPDGVQRASDSLLEDNPHQPQEPREPPAPVGPPAPPAPPPAGSANPAQPTSPIPAATYNPNWQNPTVTQNPNYSAQAPRLEHTGTNWALLEHGNRRPLQENEILGGQNYVDQYAQQNPTGFIQPGSPGYAPGQAMSNADYPKPTGSATGTMGAGGINTQRPGGDLMGSYAGFDFSKDYDLDKSAKGTFFYGTAPGAGDLRWQNSATAAAWFEQYAKPALVAKGYAVDKVEGDRAFIHTRENPEGTWIDWVQGIDGPSPKLAWQDQSYMGDALPVDSGGGMGTAIAPLQGTTGGSSYAQQLIQYLMQQLAIGKAL